MIGKIQFICKRKHCNHISYTYGECRKHFETHVTIEVEGKGVEFCKHGVLDGKKLCYRCSDD